MILSIEISGEVSTRANKKDPLNYGKFYIKPINKRGMDELQTFEGTEEQVAKSVAKFLKSCEVVPKSRTQRYIAARGGKSCYFLTLKSYKALAPYLRKNGYIA